MSKTASIIRIRRRSTPFVTLDKRFLADPRLSWGAKGLLAYLLAKPDDWQVRLSDLVKQSTDGQASCRARLGELERAGYIRRAKVRDRRSGRVIRWETVIFETPELAAAAEARDTPTLFELFEPLAAARQKPRFSRNTPEVDFRHLAEPQVENPQVENRTLLKNDRPMNELTNNNESEAERSDRTPAGAGKPTFHGSDPGPVPSSLEELDSSVVVVDEPLLTDCDDPVLMLADAGFDQATAMSLVKRAGGCVERVREVLEQARKQRKGRGWVYKAITNQWTFDARPAGHRRAESNPAERARQAEQERERDAQIAQDFAARQAVIAGMGDAEWQAHVEAMLPTLSQGLRSQVQARGAAAMRSSPLLIEQVYQRVRAIR